MKDEEKIIKLKTKILVVKKWKELDKEVKK